MVWRAFFLSGIVGVLAACEGSTPVHEFTVDPKQKPPQEKPQATPAPTPGPTPAQDVFYPQVKVQIFDQYCVRCHQQGKRKPYLQTYAQVKERIEDIEYRVFDDVLEPMPPASSPQQMTADDLAVLRKWIDTGAREAPGSQPPANPDPEPVIPPPEVVTWAQVAPIFENKCAKCHNAGSSMLDAYQTLEQVRRSVRRIMRFSVEKSVMPPAPDKWPDDQPNPNALPQNEKDLIARWVADGMKD
jgi:mono/diheme cytochrome c family protein